MRHPNKIYAVMKTLLIILPLVLCILGSCINKTTKLELEKYKARAEIEKQNMEIIRKWIEEVNVSNFEILFEKLFSQEFQHYFPSNAEPKSYEEYKQMSQQIYPAFHNLTHTIEDMVVSDSKVVARVIARAIHGGEFYGIPATGNELEWSAIAIFEISNG